ncbi:MAG TPA: FCD domain-containing protein, partial [Patescibacteria group bacterium]|nr:FCD domain-containing protein [Patescibacteria group bacterium]
MQHIMRSVFQLLRHDVFYDRRRLYQREGVRELLLRQHKAIFDAIMARDPESARAAAEKHILYARDALQESRVSEQRLEVSLRRIGRDSLAAVSDREAQ